MDKVCLDCGKSLFDRKKAKRCARCAAIKRWADPISRARAIKGLKAHSAARFPAPDTEDIELLRTLAAARAFTQAEAAEQFGYSVSYITRVLRENDISWLRKKRPENQLDSERVNQLYNDEGLTCIETAKEMGCSYETVIDTLYKNGFPTREEGVFTNVCVDCGKPIRGFYALRCRSCASKALWSDPEYRQKVRTTRSRGSTALLTNQATELRKLYEAGATATEIGETHGVSARTIIRILREASTDIRPTGAPPTTQYNHSCFDNWSPEMAYWLGLFYADGNMGRDGSRGYIGSTDPRHLEKFESFVGEGSLEQWTQGTKNHKAAYAVRFSSKQIWGRLWELGIRPAKSVEQNMHWPVDYPEWAYPHFIRGYFDGDGCAYKTQPRIGFSSTGKDFLEGLRDHLCEKASLQKHVNYAQSFVPIYEKNSGRQFELKFNGKVNLTRFYNYIYDQAEEELWLTRKRETIEGHLED